MDGSAKSKKQSNSTGGGGGGDGTQTDGGGGGGGSALPPGAAVSIVPAGLNLATAHSMSLQTMPANSRSDPTQPSQVVARVVNGVHPGTAGQGQIADAFFGPGSNFKSGNNYTSFASTMRLRGKCRGTV